MNRSRGRAAKLRSIRCAGWLGGAVVWEEQLGQGGRQESKERVPLYSSCLGTPCIERMASLGWRVKSEERGIKDWGARVSARWLLEAT